MKNIKQLKFIYHINLVFSTLLMKKSENILNCKILLVIRNPEICKNSLNVHFKYLGKIVYEVT